jgi:hypothetical protein
MEDCIYREGFHDKMIKATVVCWSTDIEGIAYPLLVGVK